MQPFSVGTVLSRSFSIWLKNFLSFTILTLLVYSPLVIYAVVLLNGEVTLQQIQTWSRVEFLAGSVLSLVAAAALTYGTFQQLRGRQATISESIAVGIKRFLPVLGVGFVAGVCIIGVTLVPSFLLGPVVSPSALTQILILLVVPQIMLVCTLWVAVPVALVEQPGVIASLKRSAELTRGSRWSILGILVALFLVSFVVGGVLQKVTIDQPPIGQKTGQPTAGSTTGEQTTGDKAAGDQTATGDQTITGGKTATGEQTAAGGKTTGDQITTGDQTTGNQAAGEQTTVAAGEEVFAGGKLFMILALLLSIIFGALQAVASAVGYHDLRQAKEGIEIEELVRVFE